MFDLVNEHNKIHVSLFAGERLVDSKQTLQRSVWTDEADSAEHLAIQPHQGADE